MTSFLFALHARIFEYFRANYMYKSSNYRSEDLQGLRMRLAPHFSKMWKMELILIADVELVTIFKRRKFEKKCFCKQRVREKKI